MLLNINVPIIFYDKSIGEWENKRLTTILRNIERWFN